MRRKAYQVNFTGQAIDKGANLAFVKEIHWLRWQIDAITKTSGKRIGGNKVSEERVEVKDNDDNAATHQRSGCG